MTELNRHLLHTVNSWAGQVPLLDEAMVFCASWLIFPLFAVAAVCALTLARRRRWWQLGSFAATLVVAFGLLRLAGCVHTDRRPFMTEHVHQLVAHQPGTSFPSDHTTAATAVALGLLAFTTFRRTGTLLLLAAVLIGFARIFAGIHWPLDIIGGLLTGLAGTAVVAGALLLGRRGRRLVPSVQGRRELENFDV
ncbi:MAG: phosphatase PAP2 family protein [Motilibacteraceae bacterium]